jgi:probable F420-dependent oxidoreductase
VKVGFVAVLADNRAGGPGSADRYSKIRERALRAEGAGYDSVWIYDHLLYRLDELDWTVGIWEGWTILTALAEATSRVELGSLVLCNTFRNPAVLAKMAHTLDEVSGGRLVLGIGAGWNQPEFDAFGIPFDRRVAKLDEALQILRPLLRDGQVDFEGEFYAARECEITPRSPRPTGPPLMVGAFGPKTIRLAARYADQWNTAYWATPEDAAEQLEMFDEAVAEVQPETPPQKTILAWVTHQDLLPPDVEFDSAIAGDPDSIAAALSAHEAAGIIHVQLHVVPYTDEAIARTEVGVREWLDSRS